MNKVVKQVAEFPIPTVQLPKFLRVLAYLVAGTVAAVLVGVTSYDAIYLATTGRPYTDIMRENPWIFPLAAGFALWVLIKRFPFQWRFRVALAWLSVGIGFVAGHVYW